MSAAAPSRASRAALVALGMGGALLLAGCEPSTEDTDASPSPMAAVGSAGAGGATSAAPPSTEGGEPAETEAPEESGGGFVPPAELADLDFPQDCEHVETTTEASGGVQAWRIVFDCPSPAQAFAHVRERLESKGYVYDGLAFWTLGTTRVALGGEHENSGGDAPGLWGMQVFRG